MNQLNSVALALEFREKRIEELSDLIRRMHAMMIEMDGIMDAKNLSLDWDRADRRAAINADANRLVDRLVDRPLEE